MNPSDGGWSAGLHAGTARRPSLREGRILISIIQEFAARYNDSAKKREKICKPRPKAKKEEKNRLFSGLSGFYLHQAELLAAEIRLSKVAPGHICGGEGLGKRDIVQKNPRVKEIAAAVLLLDLDDVMHRLTLPFPSGLVRGAGVSV